MQYIDFKTLLYSDTLVPDIFINEYLPALKSEYVKIYIYCLFLAGKNRNPSIEDLSRVLDIPREVVKDGLRCMDNLNILTWTEDGVVLKDLKEIEINRYYRPKSTATPEEAAERSRLNSRRRQVIEAINDKFYSGVMSPVWYGDIDMWFDRYGFEEDVMLMLFSHCRDSGVLTKSYVGAVAANMYSKGVKNSFDFDNYLREYEAMRTVGKQIQKNLRISGQLSTYQEAYVDKWVNKYGFTFEIIEIALKIGAGKKDPGFNFYDSILTDWHTRGLVTAEKINADQRRRKSQSVMGPKFAGDKSPSGAKIYGRAFFINRPNQKEYSEEELDSFVSNDFGLGSGKEADSGGTDANEGDGEGENVNVGVGESENESVNIGVGESENESVSGGIGESESESVSVGVGKTKTKA